MAEENVRVKTPVDSYIYNAVLEKNQKGIMSQIMNFNRIDRTSESFQNVIIDVKRRQISTHLANVLMNPHVELLMGDRPAPIAFSVIYAKDIREDKRPKVFIDMTSVLSYNSGFYETENINGIIALLMNASTRLVYNSAPSRILSNMTLTMTGTNNFVSMFTYILDYLRISGYLAYKTKISYLAALYYLYGILGKPHSDVTRNVAINVAKIDRKEADNIDYLHEVKEEDVFKDIDSFITFLTNTFKFKGLTTGVYLEKWMYLFGPGTQFGLELFPDFSAILTTVYAGTFINNAKQIEKCVGRGGLQGFCPEIMAVGKNTINLIK